MSYHTRSRKECGSSWLVAALAAAMGGVAAMDRVWEVRYMWAVGLGRAEDEGTCEGGCEGR
jgi:hypothetical protein